LNENLYFSEEQKMLYKNYFEQLKQAIPFLMKEHNVPGFSISVCDKEKIIFSDTYGFTG